MYDGQNVTTFKVKIVDFGADGAYQGGDDKEFEITRTCLKRMEQLKFRYQNLGLTTKSNVAQFVFSGSAGTIYIDNVYFNKVAIVAPPAAAHMHLYIRNRRIWINLVLTSFDNPSGASTASLLASNQIKQESIPLTQRQNLRHWLQGLGILVSKQLMLLVPMVLEPLL
jgi:hypothetical protein